MKSVIILTILLGIVQNSVAPPVDKVQAAREKMEREWDYETHPEGPPPKMDLFYQKYLEEVVDLLESDPEFRQKLRNVTQEDLQTAAIAEELKFLNHNIRDQLHETKRREVERLRHLARKEYELTNNITIDTGHIDHYNQNTFEIEDLRRLILKTTDDIRKKDQERREKFKEYEMKKKLEEERKLQGELSDEEKKKYAEELEKQKQKHKQHDPLNHPGSKKQLEEVWEKEDHMERQDFDPKTFFFMHDLDGNGVWDEDEVKALFRKELDKMYEAGAPEDDLMERAEEMERMREHVFNEADQDKNGLIDYQEFLIQTKRNEYENDPGWKPIDEQEIYTPEEFDAYRKEHEIKEQVVEGLSSSQPETAHNEQFPAQPIHQDQQVPQQQQQQYQQPPQQQQYQPPPPQQQQQYQQPPPQQYQQQQQYQQPPPQQQQQQYQQPPPQQQQQQQYQQPPPQQQQQYQQPPPQQQQQYQQPPPQQQQQYQQPPPQQYQPPPPQQQPQYVQNNQIPVQQQPNAVPQTNQV